MQQRMTGDLLGDTLIKLGFVSAKEMGIILAEQGGFSFIDLSEFSVSKKLCAWCRRKWLKKPVHSARA